MKPYSRKTYPSRGKLPTRDVWLEVIQNKKCVVCEVSLERKQGKGGRMETWERFMVRKTCGKKYVDGLLTNTDCLNTSILGDGNSNYKGIMPKCQTCGKRLNTYPAKRAKGEHCKKCYVLQQTGNYPEHLKKYSFAKGVMSGIPFKKGHATWNKMYEFCTVEECFAPHLAKGLCSKHYQRKVKSK
jgi:hypothetical protein